jgi:hypothetical protein
MAVRVVQGVLRKVGPLTRTNLKQKCLHKKFEQPFTFEEAGVSNVCNSITTYATRQISPATSEIANKSAYATVAPGLSSTFNPASKFRVPFDEGPTMSTLDNIVEQVESIPDDVQKERGYHIIGKVKASEEDMRKILAVGDMRVWQ